MEYYILNYENINSATLLSEILEYNEGKFWNEKHTGAILKSSELVIPEKLSKDIMAKRIQKLRCSLEKYIKHFGSKKIISLSDEITFSKMKVVNCFIGELYQASNDEGETYADLIYNADCPRDKMIELLNKFALIYLDFILDDIRSGDIKIKNIAKTENNIDNMKKKINEQGLDWKHDLGLDL